MVVLGSGTQLKEAPSTLTVFCVAGGHTTEMTRLLAGLDTKRYRPIIFVSADNDARSIGRAETVRQQRVTTALPHQRTPN
jgi:hypothetical protein